MILADKITLLRKKNGWSQEELAERLGVSRQAISKWESAQSTPDLKRILAMSEAFGVSTDVLLRDEMDLDEFLGHADGTESDSGSAAYAGPEPEPLRSVSMEEANEYLQMKAVSSGRIAIGVMLCILSPIALMLVSGAQEEGLLAITENQAAGIGILVLMLMVGAAVALFVYYGMKMSRFEYMEKDALETAYGVEGMVRERKSRYHGTYLLYMIIGIMLCVLSCIPIFVGLILGGSDMIMVASVCVLLVMVAIGVMMIVRTNIVMEAMKTLLEEGDYTRENKWENKRNETAMGIYWMAVTAGYLLVSFLTNRWDITWVVWPVAGVASGILAAVLKMLRARE